MCMYRLLCGVFLISGRGKMGMYHLNRLVRKQLVFRTGPTQTGLYKHRKELEA